MILLVHGLEWYSNITTVSTTGCDCDNSVSTTGDVDDNVMAMIICLNIDASNNNRGNSVTRQYKYKTTGNGTTYIGMHRLRTVTLMVDITAYGLISVYIDNCMMAHASRDMLYCVVSDNEDNSVTTYTIYNGTFNTDTASTTRNKCDMIILVGGSTNCNTATVYAAEYSCAIINVNDDVMRRSMDNSTNNDSENIITFTPCGTTYIAFGCGWSYINVMNTIISCNWQSDYPITSSMGSTHHMADMQFDTTYAFRFTDCDGPDKTYINHGCSNTGNINNAFGIIFVDGTTNGSITQLPDITLTMQPLAKKSSNNPTIDTYANDFGHNDSFNMQSFNDRI